MDDSTVQPEQAVAAPAAPVVDAPMSDIDVIAVDGAAAASGHGDREADDLHDDDGEDDDEVDDDDDDDDMNSADESDMDVDANEAEENVDVGEAGEDAGPVDGIVPEATAAKEPGAPADIPKETYDRSNLAWNTVCIYSCYICAKDCCSSSIPEIRRRRTATAESVRALAPGNPVP